MYPFLFLLLISIFSWFTRPDNKPVQQTTSTAAKTKTASSSAEIAVRVIDGDTIEISGGKKVRYIGIDSPETKDPKKTKQCFGEEAYLKNKELVEGKQIRMVKDVSETDRYGRLLRYVYVSDQNSTNSATIFVNEYLVREGFAYAVTFPPDVKYNEFFRKLQNEAMRLKRGLWGRCQ